MQDKDRFQAIGFSLLRSDGRALAHMIDYEANYAHSGDGAFPKDIPFTGSHDAGGCYGSHHFACDGENYLECESGFDGGYVIGFTGDGVPIEEDIMDTKAFLALHKKVRRMLEAENEATLLVQGS